MHSIASKAIAGLLKTSLQEAEVVIAPPALYLLLAREHLRKEFEVAAQNIFDKPNGAFTGEISADQLIDSGITWTILGHSERRTILQESDSVSLIAATWREDREISDGWTDVTARKLAFDGDFLRGLGWWTR